MKQLLLLVIAVGIALGTWFFFGGSEDESPQTADTRSSSSSSSTSPAGDNGFTGDNSFDLETDTEDEPGDNEEEEEEYDERPAAEIYSNLDDALEAVKKGALDYDDIILEQFVEPGEDCTWCPEFYSKITELMKEPGASEDEYAYYSEILAISGDVDNIKTLVEAVRDTTDENAADIFAESLELTIGNDEVVKYLSDFVEDENELLQEASVAAITNQGSRLAAETLYEHTKKVGDANGYYDIGIGLGELIPEEEALPFLQEKMLERDELSHLSVKALLNYGYDGLVLVFDALKNSSNPDFDKTMLTDAIDHVGYEEETETFVKKVLEGNPSPGVKEFGEEILEAFSLEDALDAEEEELE